MIRTGDYASVKKGVEKGRVIKISGDLVYLDVDGFEIPFQKNEVIRIPEPGSVIGQPNDSPTTVSVGKIDFADLGIQQAGLGIRLIENDEKKDFQIYVLNPTAHPLQCRIFEEKNRHWTLIFEAKVEDRNYLEGPIFTENEVARLDRLMIQFLFTPLRVYENCLPPIQEEHNGMAKRMLKSGTFTDHAGMKLWVWKGKAEMHREWLEQAAPKPGDIPTPKPPVNKGMTEDEIDLHIEELMENFSGMSKHEILLAQISACRKKIESCILNKTQKLLVIHGIGSGRLKEEVIKLVSEYEHLRWKPASPQFHGAGAMNIFFV